MRIQVAQSAGFCPGVKQAVETAGQLLADGRDLTMLGEIVHNRDVVEGLIAQGADLAENAEEVAAGSRVLIRAHGVPPSVEQSLRELDCEVIDRTCGFVKKIHQIVQKAGAAGKGVLIAGDPNHPEVLGIRGYAGSRCVIVSSPQEAQKLELSGDSWILTAQTTFSVGQYAEIIKVLQNKIANLEIFDTICYTTFHRQEEAASLAKQSDLMLVLGSAHSSNTNKLVSVCREYCRDTYLIQRPDEIPQILSLRDLSKLRVGVTAGASTPERMIREVIQVMTEHEVLNNQQEEQNVIQPAAEEAVETVETVAVEVEEQADLSSEESVEAASGAASEELDEAEKEVAETEEEDAQDAQDESADSNLQDQGDVNFSDFIDSIPQLKRGTTVKGALVRYDDEFVYVDVKDKSEGKIPRHEFEGDPELDLETACADHQEIDVYVRNIRNTDMGKEIVLSKAKVDFAKHKDAIEQACQDKIPVSVKVTNVVRDGVIASYGSVDLYIHRTQLELQMVEDLEPYRGQTFDVLITQFDPDRRRLRVSGSRRSLLQRERRERAKQVWEDIEVDKDYDGIVRNLTDFGAFVDIGGVDGLVHISELSWDRIRHPSEVVSVGDHLKVFIKDFDRERKRVSLGFKRPENDPYYNIEERFPAGSIVRGVVVRMFPFGAFVEIAPGVDALCHISQISDYRLNRPEDVLQEGMEIDARVIEVNNAERKISISIKEVEPINPENMEDQPMPERRRRPGRKQQQQADDDGMMTAYTDTTSGSTLSALADITFSSEDGQKVLDQLTGQAAAEEAEAEEAVEAAEEAVEEVAAEAADVAEAVQAEEENEAVSEVAEEAVAEDAEA